MNHDVRSSLFALITAGFAAAAVASPALEGVARADEAVDPVLAAAPVLPANPGAAETTPASSAASAPPAELAPLPGSPPPAPAAAPLAPLPAPGSASGAELAADGEHRPNPVLQPWQVDTRASIHTTPIFQYGGVGASADAGMRKLGPGTLALGGGLDYFFCGTTCSSAPLSFMQNQLSLEARLSYHLAPPKIGRVDVYPLVTAGFVMSRASIKVETSEYRGSDVAPSVGFGAGASYFFADRFFVAVEARFRYAAGTYSYELASGTARPFDRSGIDAWSASTVDLAGAVGARF